MSRRPAVSSSIRVAPFKKYLLNSLTLGSKSFNRLISLNMGSQLLIGYKLRHFSKPLLMTNRALLSSESCFLKPDGKRKRPFGSSVASYSPRKPIIYSYLYLKNFYYHKLTLFPTFMPNLDFL